MRPNQSFSGDRYYCDSQSHKFNLSFAGCGFLGVYHSGVICCIKEFAPHLFENRIISGVSAGSIAATCLVCDVELKDFITFLNEMLEKSRQYLFGPFDPRYCVNELLKEGLDRLLPKDAHVICSGRLHISLTALSSKKNVIVSEFKTREELIRVVLCSSFIPLFSGFIPMTYKGEWVMDGALTNNMLDLDKNTLTISPFAGDADICPRGEMLSTPIEDCFGGQVRISATTMAMNMFNGSRLLNVVFPMRTQGLIELVEQGYSDARRFLLTRGFVVCKIHRTPYHFINRRQRSFSDIAQPAPAASQAATRKISEPHSPGSRAPKRKRRSVESSPSTAPDVSSPTFAEMPLTKSDRALFLGACRSLEHSHCQNCRKVIARALTSQLPEEVRVLMLGDTNDKKSFIARAVDSCLSNTVVTSCRQMIFGYFTRLLSILEPLRHPLTLSFSSLDVILNTCYALFAKLPDRMRNSFANFMDTLQQIMRFICHSFRLSYVLNCDLQKLVCLNFHPTEVDSCERSPRIVMRRIADVSNAQMPILHEGVDEIAAYKSILSTSDYGTADRYDSSDDERNQRAFRKTDVSSRRPTFTCYDSDTDV